MISSRVWDRQRENDRQSQNGGQRDAPIWSSGRQAEAIERDEGGEIESERRAAVVQE